jgi:hypothetical protein
MTTAINYLSMMLLFILMLPFVVAGAEQKPLIQRFGDSDLPVVHTKIRFTTLILLPEGEEIASVTCGDKEFWVIEDRDNIVFVKPSKEGATTNVNIVSKRKAIYSFLVKEVSKQGKGTEKPDFKVVLEADQISKLRRDKEELEEALARSEKSVEELKEKAEAVKKEALKKKDEPLPSPVVPAEAEQRKPREVVAKPAPVVKAKVISEAPLVRTYTVERRDGLLRKSTRAFGRFISRVRRTLRIP